MFTFISLVLFFLTGSCIDIKTVESNELRRKLVECNPSRNEGCEAFVDREYPSPLERGYTCQDYHRLERKDDSSTINLIESFDLEKQTVGLWRSVRFNTFLHVKVPDVEKEFLLCSMHKNGSLRMKVLLRRILGLKNSSLHETYFPNIRDYEPFERNRLLRDSNVTRIKVVRNPYVRAVSMFKDKVLPDVQEREPGVWKVKNFKFEHSPTFEQFVEQLYELQQQEKIINFHFATQYQNCWEHEGLAYDYILKVERMNYWYPCFIEEFNLWKYVMDGWPKEGDCYLSTPDVPCHGPIQDEDGGLHFEGIKKEKESSGVNPDHNKHASQDFQDYYKNETIARMVTQIWLADIAQYHYPFWTEFM